MSRSFNLIDEPWIPIADVGRVSLHQIFSDASYTQIGGNPVQKIALTKLLLSIAQAAYTPAEQKEWQVIGAEGLAEKCLAYLHKWFDRFDLYDVKRPFLQMPAVAAAEIKPYGAVLAEVSTGNTTVLTQSQVEQSLDDADKALLLVVQMGFALSGKKTDNNIVLTPNYTGKTNAKGKAASGKPGSGMAHLGLLHNLLLGKSVQQTLWLNLLTYKQINDRKAYEHGVGIPPWEQMPSGEDCQIARRLKQSLQGRLVSMGRFCLLTDKGMHYSEGITYAGYKDGGVDPSVAINYGGKEPKAMWCDPDKRPWREVTALLSFLEQSHSQGFQSWQIASSLDRTRDVTDVF